MGRFHGGPPPSAPTKGQKNLRKHQSRTPKTGYKHYKRIYLHKDIGKVNNVKSKDTYIVCDPSLPPHPAMHTLHVTQNNLP
jgi:hypothetical protein